MSAINSTAEAIDSPSTTELSRPNSFTSWGHEEHDTTIPTDFPTLAMGNKTDFYPQSVDGGVSHNPSGDSSTNGQEGMYHRIRKHNRDNAWGYRTDVKLYKGLDDQYKRGVIGSFSVHLGLSDLLTQRAFEWFLKLDLQRMGLRIEMVAFAICITVVNEEADRYDDSGRAYDPQHSNVVKFEDFRTLQNNLIDAFGTVTKNQITATIQKIQQGSPPIRPERKWKRFVQNEAFVPLLPCSGGEVACHER